MPVFDFLILSLFLLSFSFYWLLYFIIKNGVPSKLGSKKMQLKVKTKNLSKSTNGLRVTRALVIPPFVMLLLLSLCRGFEGIYVLNFFYFTNELIGLVYFFLILNIFTWFWTIKLLEGLKFNLTLDYFFSLAHLLFYMPFIIWANSLLGLFFVVELASGLMLYSFVSTIEINVNKKNENKPYFSLIFFQFWVSFFSSILLIYTITNFSLLFGSTEWIYLNLGIKDNNKFWFAQSLTWFSILLTLVGVLLKLGVGPFFAYKLEIYRGLPLYLLVFYSLTYFFIFVSIFFTLFGYYLNDILSLIIILLNVFISGTIVAFLFFLFDTILLKQFFALSSIINTIILLVLLFS